MMRVSGLYCYPVKSLRGTELPEMDIDQRGPAMDRRWMVVDDSNRFVTQRSLPRMALIDVTWGGGELTLSAPDYPDLTLRNPCADGLHRSVAVWRDQCEAVDAGPAAARWLSQWLGQPLRLVFMPDSTQRQVNPEYAAPGETVSFVDGFPFLLTSTGSLDDLNRRLSTPLPMIRFRPNIIVDQPQPFAEDGWHRIRIGEVSFRVARACARCSVPTIDPETGVAGVEPMRTLKQYRRRQGGVFFGQNLIHEGPGRIRRGDQVKVLD